MTRGRWYKQKSKRCRNEEKKKRRKGEERFEHSAKSRNLCVQYPTEDGRIREKGEWGEGGRERDQLRLRKRQRSSWKNILIPSSFKSYCKRHEDGEVGMAMAVAGGTFPRRWKWLRHKIWRRERDGRRVAGAPPRRVGHPWSLHSSAILIRVGGKGGWARCSMPAAQGRS